MKVKILLLLSVLGIISCQKNDAQFVTDKKEFSEKNETEVSQENSQNTSEKETSTEINSVENTSLDRKEQFFRKMLNAVLQGKHSVEVSEFQISEIHKVTGKDYLYATDEEYKIWFDEFKLNYPFLYHLDYWQHYSRQYNPENPQWVQSYNLEYSILVEQM